jgi:high-affinity iron transporter
MRRWSLVMIVAVALAGGAGVAGLEVFAQPGDPKAAVEIYQQQCAKCHGDNGAGDGPEGAKVRPTPSDWTVGNGLKGMSDQEVFDSIAKGGRAVGKARSMPAYPKLSEAEVWNLVALCKSFQK